MATTTVTKGTIWEDTGATLLARVTGNDAENIEQADITSIAYQVFDLSGATPDTATATGTLTVANVVFDTLQTDSRWTVDSTGYNFKDAIAATVFPTGDHDYRVEYVFDAASGEDFVVVFDVRVKAIRSS